MNDGPSDGPPPDLPSPAEAGFAKAGGFGPQGGRLVSFPQAELELLLEAAAARGARQALKEIGLDNGEAREDVRELRSLLQALRLARRTAWQTAVRILTTALILALLAGAALKLKLLGEVP